MLNGTVKLKSFTRETGFNDVKADFSILNGNGKIL